MHHEQNPHNPLSAYSFLLQIKGQHGPLVPLPRFLSIQGLHKLCQLSKVCLSATLSLHPATVPFAQVCILYLLLPHLPQAWAMDNKQQVFV